MSVDTFQCEIRNISVTLEKLGLELCSQTPNQEDRLFEVFEQFSGGARKEIEKLSHQLTTTIAMYQELELYFGEEISPKLLSFPVFTTFHAFVVAFEVFTVFSEITSLSNQRMKSIAQ